MHLLDAATALVALLQLLMLPAVLMLAAGLWLWYFGHQQCIESRLRMGRMLTMMGIIFLVILLVTSQFLLSMPAR